MKLAAKALKQHEDSLTRVLHNTMPGLVQLSSEQTAQVTLSSVGADDRILTAGQRHRSLVRPDAFHVSVIFLPTSAFLDRVADILPAGVDIANASSNILDEFVLKVYLPQLDEKVSTLFHQAVTGACSSALLVDLIIFRSRE
jgi:exocyst complex component 4